MKLYRAVPRRDFEPGRRYRRHPTMRAPMNVPFVVDNLWELLRPDHMPSRRHAAYASPTPELALANASAAVDGGYVVCEVVFEGEVRVAQLSVTDARHHPDVRALQRLMVEALADECAATATLEARCAVAPIFMPTITRDAIGEAMSRSPALKEAVGRASDASRFWSSASTVIDPASSGEVFFELVDKAKYQLRAIELGNPA